MKIAVWKNHLVGKFCTEVWYLLKKTASKKIPIRYPSVCSSILTLFILLLQSIHVSENYRGRLRLGQSGLGGLLLHMKSFEQRGSESAFIDLVFKCNFSLKDKFSLINYLASNEGAGFLIYYREFRLIGKVFEKSPNRISFRFSKYSSI